jgi:PAS domain S-box-containing protein
MLQKELVKVIGVDKNKCVNCHVCISACPVKYCNNGSGDVVEVNHNLCIACGSCLSACTHGARYYIDDFDLFLDALKQGEKIVAIVAPSITANFHDNFLNLNGWLKSIGVKAIFDVSFGAELTVASYLHHLKTKQPQTVIAQPCAAIVSFIEIYKPELLEHLIPVDSPMLHTMKLIKNFYKEYSDHKIAVISPCLSKKREFEETSLGNYNVSFLSVYNYLEKNQIKLENFPTVGFDNPPAERAVMFSSPGGLMQTAERWFPEIRNRTRKIEGVSSIYEYLETLPQMIKEGKSPLLVDCLSCEKGCNGGPLTLGKDKPVDEIEYWVSKRNKEMQDYYEAEAKKQNSQANKQLEALIMQYWDENLYNRSYQDLSGNYTLKIPNESELKGIYEKMHKYSDKDIFNCSSCGYTKCEKMAIAIFNGLNKPENCHFYLFEEGELAHKETKEEKAKILNILGSMTEGFIQINEEFNIESVNQSAKDIFGEKATIGLNFLELFDETNQELIKSNLQKIRIDGRYTYEMLIKGSHSNMVYCLFNHTLLKDSENKPNGSFLVITDLTELKIAEIELRKSKEDLEFTVATRTSELTKTVDELLNAEAEIGNQRDILKSQNEQLSKTVDELKTAEEEIRQQVEEIAAQRNHLEDTMKELKIVEGKISSILQNIPDAVMVIDKQGIVISWNIAMENLTKIKAKNIVGKGDYEYALPFYGSRRKILIDLVFEPVENFANKYTTVQRNGDVLIAEAYMPNYLNAGEFYMHGTATALKDGNGNIVGAIEIVRDVTQRVLAERKIQEQQEQLLIRNEEFRIKIEELTVAEEEIRQQSEEISTQRDTLQSQNEKLSETLELLEKSQSKIIESEKMVALGQLIAGVAHEINTPLGAIRSSVGNISSTLEHVLNNLAAFFKILEEQDKLIFFALLERSVNASIAITSKEERAFKRELISILEAENIEKADEYADTLVDMGIYGQIEPFIPFFHSPKCEPVLQMAYKVSGLLRSSQTITTATERASKVVFALKNYAHYDHSGEATQAQITDSIETVLTLYYNQLKHGVTLVKNYSENLPLILCYPDELNQVWTNIIHNALQAMDHKGTLTINIIQDKLYIYVGINDSGKGIPEEIKDKIFDAFFTTKPQGEGSGLGLDIVRRIIEKHGGKISFESKPGNTTFTVKLPKNKTS